MGVLQSVDALIVNLRCRPYISCTNEKYPSDKMKEIVDDKKIPRCPECDGLVKPDIVFFGEALPERFFARRVDMHHAGTSYSSHI